MALSKRALYPLVLLSAVALDCLWIGVLCSRFYLSELGSLLRLEIPGDPSAGLAPVWGSAAIVYVLMAIGVIELALPHVDRARPWSSSFRAGGLLGLVVYGIYDFTNYSLLKDWTLGVTLVDTAWGVVICSLLTAIAAKFRAQA